MTTARNRRETMAEVSEEMMLNRAQVLIEALPHIQKYYGKTVVVKII